MAILARPSSAAEFCTLGEAADFLSLTERSIRRYIADGKLPAYRIGTKQIRVRASDVEALLVPIPTGDAAPVNDFPLSRDWFATNDGTSNRARR